MLLILAAYNGHTDTVELLLKQPANKVNAKNNELFSVVKCDNVNNLAQEYGKLFTWNTKSILNSTIPDCISKISLLNKTFEKNA